MLRMSLGILVGLVAVAEVFASGEPWKQPTKVVQTSFGPIRGEEMQYGEFRYKAFRGIPYAAPPVGNLRFKDPQPPEIWTSVRDAQDSGKSCHQAKHMNDTSEDCLSLNVFTPSLEENGSKPVLVWIHGGGFRGGSGNDDFYGPQYLVQEDIVIVTLNYRLGPLGFLSTNTSESSGNWGMKDQVAALRWVQRNIANFGGDPDQVTIYGESAGGASVHLHLFSPLSKGLFHRVISASGTGINDWSMTSPQKAAQFSMTLARLLGASEAEISDPAKRVEFFRKADPDAISEQARNVGKEDGRPLGGFFPFTPVIENPGTQGAFLTEDPKKILLEGSFTKVPMMIGVTDLEGGVSTFRVKPEYIQWIEKNVCGILPDALKNPVVAKNECAQVAQEIRNTYFGGKPFDSSLLNYAYLASDLFMARQVYVAQRLHARLSTPGTPVYNYMFAFDGQWNIIKKSIKLTLPGAIHGDDLGYVFMPASRSAPGSNRSPEVITKNRMVRFITNFAKHGNPTPSVSDLIPVMWEPATADTAKTMVIGNELKMENEFLKSRMGLWDRLYEKYIESPLLA